MAIRNRAVNTRSGSTSWRAGPGTAWDRPGRRRLRTGRTKRERCSPASCISHPPPELVAKRVHARELTRRYNATSPRERAARRRLLIVLLAVGEDVEVEPPFHALGAKWRAGRNV
jgi:Maltose acetyltransferase hexapeptide capping motif